MTKHFRCLAAALFVAALGAMIAPASAEETLKNEEILAVRQALMRTNSAYEGLLTAQSKGEVTIPANQLKQIGEAWLRMGKAIPVLFQKGSEGIEKSRAKPEIWSNPDDFKLKLAAYAKATEKFQQVTQNAGDKAAVDAAFVEVNKACDDCHKGYRTPAQR
jgi:cytochrome c556